MQSSLLQIETSGPVATIWLNRPEVRNALNETLIADLHEVFSTLEKDETIRVIILAGRGKVFCAGADLDWMRRMADFTAEQNLEDAHKAADMFHCLDSCSKPVIARVHGDAYGGGIGLLALCDIAVAVEEAAFALSEVKLGLVAATISPYVIRAMGPRQARRFALTAEKFNVQTALNTGLVHEVCNAATLDETIEDIVQNLLQASPQAITSTKQLFAQIGNQPINKSVREVTAACIAQARASEDGREGIAAFLAKRNPRWVQ